MQPKPFNLTYIHRETGKLIKVRRIELGRFKIQDPETLEERFITTHFLLKEYSPCPGNHKAGLLAVKARGMRKRRTGRRKLAHEL